MRTHSTLLGAPLLLTILFSCACVTSSSSQDEPVLSSTKQPLQPTSFPLVVNRSQTLSTDNEEDDDEEGEDLPSQFVNGGRSPRPIPPLSSADLEEKLRRLTETMEKIQRDDHDDQDVTLSQQGTASRIVEHSGNRPPWDQSDDEDDEPYPGSGSGDAEQPHAPPDDVETIQGVYPSTKHASDEDVAKKKATDKSRRDGSSSYSRRLSAVAQNAYACLTMVIIYRWYLFVG